MHCKPASCFTSFTSVLATLALAGTPVGCGDSAPAPAPTLEVTSELTAVGVNPIVDAEPWSPSGPAPVPGAGQAAPGLPDEPSPDLPVVWTAPATESLPCLNRQHAFDFDPTTRSFSKLNAFWMMWLAMRAFGSDDPTTREEFESLGFHEYFPFDDERSGLQAFVAGSDHIVFISFRGSTQIRDYISNARFGQNEGKEVGVAGRLHSGFGSVLKKNWKALYTIIEGTAKGREIWLSGHSLGGALALISAVRLAREGYDIGGVYAFAPPRGGNSEFARDALERLEGRTFRIVNHLDLTPHIPPARIAAEEASAVLGFDPVEGWAASVVARLDYAHGSTMYLLGQDNELSLIGTNGDWEDKEYWTERAEHTANLADLVADDREHADRHDHRTYLCKMQALKLQLARASRRARNVRSETDRCDSTIGAPCWP